MQLASLISSPMGLGETRSRWLPIEEARQLVPDILPGKDSWRIIGGFFIRVVDFQEPEVKILITRYKFD